MSPAAENSPAARRTAILKAADAEDLAERLRVERGRVRDENQRHPSGRATCRALSDRADWAIQRLFALALPEDRLREHVVSRVAVAATGGYGRRELCGHSDIDVTFMVAEEEDETLDAVVRHMFLSLMHVFGQRLQLKVGYGYRTPADLSQLDHQSQAALLDARLVVGSHSLCEHFGRELIRQLWPAAFVRQKVSERMAMRGRPTHGLYRVEPHVRDGGGGLRDIHLAEWLSIIAFPGTRGDVWRQLQRLGVVSRRDVGQVQAAREFLLTLRNWMHFEAGRQADLMVRERQEKVAAALGYEDGENIAAVERLMADYYGHAENVLRVNGFVVERVFNERLSLTDELVAVGGEVEPAYPWVNVARPAFQVGLCEQFQAHELVPGQTLRRMIAEHLADTEDLTSDMDSARRFVALLRARRGVHATLELMASLGILQQLLPELGEAYRRVPFDAIHQFTIGHHALQVVSDLEALRETEDERLLDLRRVWNEVEAPELLFLAALLHDIGKLLPRPGHAESGARMAGAIGERLGLDESQRERVAALVRHHSLMSETAQLRDLNQQQTVADFVALIDNPDLLSMLLLLTHADLEATGVLSPVRVRFLQDLFYRAEARLSDDLALATDADRVRQYRSRLSRRLSHSNLSPEQIEAHCEQMPVAYLLNTPVEQIAGHIRLVETLTSTSQPAIEFSDDSGADITTLSVCTFDAPEPGLLSRLAGVLYAHEVSVHGAQVFTSTGVPAVALDTLWIDFHGRQVPPIKRIELEQALAAVIQGEPVDRFLDRSHKRLPPALAPRSIRFDNELAENHTVLDVDVHDQPGLLYRITRAIAALGWHIHSARIWTTGERARDAFYLTDGEHNRLLADTTSLEGEFLQEFMRD